MLKSLVEVPNVLRSFGSIIFDVLTDSGALRSRSRGAVNIFLIFVATLLD